MVVMGERGYLNAARKIMRTADAIREGLTAIPEIKVIGNPTYCIAITSDVLNIYYANDFMASRGWRLNGLQRPPGFHICITLPQTAPSVAERFVADLRDAVAYAKNPPARPPKSGAVYGSGASAIDPSIVNELMVAWLDATSELE